MPTTNVLRADDFETLGGDGGESFQRSRRALIALEIAVLLAIKATYRALAFDARTRVRAVTHGTINPVQAAVVVKDIAPLEKTLHDRVLRDIERGIRGATAAPVASAQALFEPILGRAFTADEVAGFFRTLQAEAYRAAIRRTHADNMTLSPRVWRAGRAWMEAIRRQVEESAKRGETAVELASRLDRYLRPGVFTAAKREIAGRLDIATDVSYQGTRLARTELAQAYQDGMIWANKFLPSYQGIYWRLSATHALTDICDEYAQHNGDGFWPAGDEPAVRPHPQCACVIIPVHRFPERYGSRFAEWAGDPASEPEIERWFARTGSHFFRRPSS